jgi:hypothetical protein
VSGTFERWQDDAWKPGDAYISVYHDGAIVHQFFGHIVTVSASTVPTGVEEKPGTLPEKFSLSQNYPNPFNPTTTIGFTIQDAGFTSLKIYDALGREVATLIDGVKEAGSHTIAFNAAGLSSGVYFYTLRAGNAVATKKMLLLK